MEIKCHLLRKEQGSRLDRLTARWIFIRFVLALSLCTGVVLFGLCHTFLPHLPNYLRWLYTKRPQNVVHIQRGEWS